MTKVLDDREHHHDGQHDQHDNGRDDQEEDLERHDSAVLADNRPTGRGVAAKLVFRQRA